MMITEEMVVSCIAKLSAEGIPAYIGTDPDNGYGSVLRVPRLENDAGALCQMRIYGFISCKLHSQKRKGLRMAHPFTGALYHIYCYDPDSKEDAPDASDLMVWTAHGDTEFNWTTLSLGGGGWDNGWEIGGCEGIERRFAFLTYLMTYEIIDL